MLIIAVVVSVSIGITKAKLDNIVSYTYYNAYSTMRKISTEMLADWNPKDPEYKQALNKENKFNIQLKFANIKDNILGIYRDLWTQPAQARCLKYFVPHNSSCIEAGGNVCSSDHEEGVGCYECCTPRCPASCPPCYKIEQMYGKCFCSRDETCGDGNSCSLTCGSGFTLNKTTCLCECNRTCGSGYRLNVDTCSCDPSYECWDGSFATSESKCPGYVDCWDGSKKYNWSECPPCPNKPSGPAPCGQHWDEKTCSYTGTAKTCPSGQHLNSSCQCVVDCPSDLTLCKRCDTETGVISQNPDINRTCTDETYEWNEDQCKCVQSPRTLPRKGENFCKLFERHSNIMGNTDICLGSVVSDATTDFTGKKADITLGNGIRLYNMHRDATEIDVLADNIQGGAYEGVPNTNSYGYTVYVDIDGAKGDSQLWSDVYPFYVTLSGKIIPAYDKANPGVSGGDSTHHLQVSVQYEDYSSGNRRMKWLSKSTSFKEGACLSGYIGDATPYCKDSGAVSKLSECTTDSNSMCHLKHIQPVKFFF